MTYLEAINGVLLRMRSSQVSSWDASDYSKLVGQFVNEAKREVEDAHEWHTLRNSGLTALIGQGSAQASFPNTNERTRIIQVFDDDQNCLLYPKRRNEITRLKNQGTNSPGQPGFYALSGYTDAGLIEIEIWPDSDGSRTIRMDAIVPQSDLMSNNTVISVSSAPVKLRALALALAERGDDQGQSFAQVMNEYQIALTDAVNRDKDNGPDHEAWYVP